MPSPKNPSGRHDASITSAAAKTRSAIEGLQESLSGDAESSVPPYVSPVPRTSLDRPEETNEDLERQLQSYFARASSSRGGTNVTSSLRTQILDELRNRVIDGVAERIIAEWACPQSEASRTLGSELMERLIERLLEQLRKPAEISKIELTM